MGLMVTMTDWGGDALCSDQPQPSEMAACNAGEVNLCGAPADCAKRHLPSAGLRAARPWEGRRGGRAAHSRHGLVEVGQVLLRGMEKQDGGSLRTQ